MIAGAAAWGGDTGRRTGATRSIKCRLLHPVTAEPAGVLEADLSWSDDDPDQVQVDFCTGVGAVCWEVGRDLLVAGLSGPVALLHAPDERSGLSAPTGLGPVALLHAPDDRSQLDMFLFSPNGTTIVRLAALDLAAFLHDTGAPLPGYDLLDLQRGAIPTDDGARDDEADDGDQADGDGTPGSPRLSRQSVPESSGHDAGRS